MSFMPPADQAPPEEQPQNGGPPENEPAEKSAQSVIDDCLHAIGTYANAAEASQDPAAAKDFAAAAFYLAQSVEKLMPQKPSPDVQAKVDADMVRQGSQHAHDQVMQDRKEAHDLELKKLDVQKQQKVRVDRSDGSSSTYTKEG